MFVCLDPCTWQGREYDNHSTPLSQIDPAKLDTDQWCRAAKLWGAKEILFVANHAFDCVGAKAYGMRTAFIDRRKRPYGNWPYQPDIVVPDLKALADALA